jgi:signal peptidase I
MGLFLATARQAYHGFPATMDSISNTEALPEVTPASQITTKHRIFSALLSAALPGAGHLLLGKTKAGFGFLCAFCVLTLMYWPLRPKSWLTLELLTLALIVLCTVAGWHALRAPSQRALQGPRIWLVWLLPCALLLAYGHSNWLLRAAGIRPFGVPSTGMEPTISQGGHIVVDLRQYRDSKPKYPDIVVIRKDGIFFVKRVIAVGGDIIEGKNGAIIVNGSRLEEPYVQHIGNPKAPVQLNEFGPIYVPPGKLFVMGDNRDVSWDSRMPEFGLVGEETIAGRVLYLLGSKSNRNRIDLR